MRLHFIGFDLETTGDKLEYALQPYRLQAGQCKVSAFACVDENGFVIDKGLWPTVDQLRTCLEKIAGDPWAVVIGWNTVFDVSWLIALGLEDVCRRIVWMDGQILRRGLENTTENSGWGLKATVVKWLPQFAGYENEVGGNFQKVDETLLEYNVKDSHYTAMLGRAMWDAIEPRPATIVQVTCQGIVAFARAWLDGVPMSHEALNYWHEYCTLEMNKALAASDFDAPTMRSPQKLLAALQAKGFSITGTDKKVLSLFANHPVVSPVRAFKRASGSISRYINNARKCMDYIGTNTVHPQPRLWGTYTGRCTYGSKQKVKSLTAKGKEVNRNVQIGVALHQWPKKREGSIARSCIVAPPGYLLAEFDFSNQESRILADLTQDRLLLEVFNDGKDFHCIMGAKAARVPYDEMVQWFATGDKEADRFRQMGKVANLSLCYRTGAETFQTMARTDYDVVLTFDEAANLCRLFKETYPRVVAYWSAAIAIAKQKSYAETAGGRRVVLDQWNRNSGGYASEQTAINFPVQGTGADMKFLGIALTDAYMQTRGARYMLDLHDALFVVIPDDARAMETAREIQKILSTLPYTEVYGWTPTVPMPVDGKIGKSWGSLKAIK